MKRRSYIAILGLLAWTRGPLRAEIVDRVAAIVGAGVITESRVIRELRATALFNDEPLLISPQTKRAAVERLIDRVLIARELALPLANDGNDKEALEAFIGSRDRQRFASPEAKAAGLRKYNLTTDDWRYYLTQMYLTLKLVDLRFRPAVQLSDADVQDYYQIEFLPQWVKKNGAQPPPTLTDSRPEVEAAMIDARIDQALSRWLNQTRLQARIELIDEALQ